MPLALACNWHYKPGMEPTAPIGIFDSGVGGLTVVRAVHEQLPKESVLYLGDTARVPYGTKSSEVVQRYALKCAEFLKSQGAKANKKPGVAKPIK